MNTWTIYMYTFPNGKRYIGKTKRRLSQRQGNTTTWSGYRNCTLLWKAIQKYGVENIQQTILVSEIMEDSKANEMEKQYIEFYKTSVKKYGAEYGYNLTAGGDGVTDVCYSEEERQRHIKQMCENGRKHKGIPLSEEHKRKLSEAKTGSRHPLYGRHLSDEVKMKIGKANSKENMSEETRKRRSDSKKKKIIATSLKDGSSLVFSSSTEAAKYFHVHFTTMSQWCHGTRRPSIPYTFQIYSPTTTERERRESVCNSLSSSDTVFTKLERGAQEYPDSFGSSLSA